MFQNVPPLGMCTPEQSMWHDDLRSTHPLLRGFELGIVTQVIYMHYALSYLGIISWMFGHLI
ncbi:hypothetical protein BDV38DRAFT_107423 [Aspergillus pseudotamarii]|uniref:Uncharacterized protein n=1 Tax=Aspergillus pseudotamarii TaxID=132259 RepID=A0A5N6SSD2_ASPPS|nr:uncharacterized protein BDV38DRAFT_107423 [Aspergillus pseudotamarii]KAE8136701.1 hypothetical protein BDV38DRAFT_107423 [Aspergillus pseudotamarii]